MDSRQIAEIAANACDDKKAKYIKIIEVTKVTTLTDWILITEGFTAVQVKAIINSVENQLQEKANRLPIRKEGINEGKWALLDYGELIVNVLQPQERKFYELESFWGHGKVYKFEESNFNEI
mgnify:CR=1 FL=1|tara:strand:- start:240 stop:605 length:366 start_codon:yes stop_codon:yes gene_type:complete